MKSPDYCATPHYSSIAQSAERMTVNHDVTGSSPVRGAINKKTRTTVRVFLFILLSAASYPMKLYLTAMPIAGCRQSGGPRKTFEYRFLTGVNQNKKRHSRV